MNTFEKTFYYASMAMLYAAVVLHILHIIEPSLVILLLTAGMGLFGVANLRRLRRLQCRNAALETELRNLQAAFRPGGVTEI
ncbi:PEP-CTERM sorting domain-containing protein [Hymenobacter koreensis]|uniref:DUF4229 domain-containing protein n=1 Tax=Hymenobacter koreensis TaxID=1084523 RepID=A0ABP8J1I6_9BACT